VSNQQQKPKQQLECPKCGSTHFMEGQFRTYYNKMPSSMPGGDLLPFPPLGQQHAAGFDLHLWRAGSAGTLRQQISGDRASFQKSFLAA
jgi:hypothetical protein